MTTAVIVNYNAGEHLQACVRSLLAQVPQPRVVVVDNASTDGSVAALGAALSQKAPVTVDASPRNVGFAAACNRALRAYRDDTYLIVNPDCALPAGALERLETTLSSDPRIAIVGALICDAAGRERRGARRRIPTPWRSLMTLTGAARLGGVIPVLAGMNLAHEPLPEEPADVEAVSGACMLVRGAFIAEQGGMDDGYFLHCEDLDLCLQASLAGWRVVVDPGVRAVHEGGVSSAHAPVRVLWAKHRGMVRFYRKHFAQRWPRALRWLVPAATWLRCCLMTPWVWARARLARRGAPRLRPAR